MMRYFTYSISSLIRKYIYVGITYNPARRFDQHNKGQNKTTKPYLPFEILLIEEHSSREDARKREKFLKSGAGKVFLKKIQNKCRDGGIGRRTGLKIQR